VLRLNCTVQRKGGSRGSALLSALYSAACVFAFAEAEIPTALMPQTPGCELEADI
jgi:hypothetical protein